MTIPDEASRAGSTRRKQEVPVWFLVKHAEDALDIKEFILSPDTFSG